MKAVIFLALLATVIAAPSTSKISVRLQKSLLANSRTNIIVSFESTQQTLQNLASTTQALSHGQKATAVYQALTAHAKNSQVSALQLLNSRVFFSTKVKSFWISNQIYVQGADSKLVHALAQLPEVAEVHEEITIELEQPATRNDATSKDVEWNIELIQAPEAWAVAGDGEGVVVGIIDTGARHTHESIAGSYRAGTHSWYDPYRTSEEPRDGNGHGTHVTGTTVGINGIGVAPGAKWISCKGLNDIGIGTESALLACGEFMVCPHEYNGDNPDCSLGAHVVSNSWGGSGGQTFYDPVIEAWHAVNLTPVFAAGNSGPRCETLGSPADSLARVIAVASSTINDAIALTSSRGPSSHTAEHKPDVAAPGQNINSASHQSDTEYTTKSGTSMACPHVAGLVALIKSNNLDATYDQVWSALTTSAVQELTFGNSECEGIGESEFPNYSFGYGRINALAAVQTAKMS